MPRGPIQAIINFSLNDKSEPIEETKTATGLAIKIIIPSRTIAGQPTKINSAISIRAASTIKRTDINNTLKLSLKSRILSISISFIFAIVIPITVTASSPDSGSIVSDKTNTVKTEINVKIFLRYCGTSCFRNKLPNDQAEIKPIRKPDRMIFPNARNIVLSTLCCCPEIIKSKTRTASKAPSGSITIPSQRSTLATFVFGLTILSMGIMTVGPVTTTIAPNKKASSIERSSKRYVL